MNATVPDGPSPSPSLPGAGQRLRCAACGNLTRFDVVVSRRTSAYWHYSLAGELSVEAEQDLDATPELVRCRWCQSENIEVVPVPGADQTGSAAPPTTAQSGH